MKISKESIINTIDSVFVKGNYFYSEAAVNMLKCNESVNLIKNILENSDKTPSEAVIIVLAAIRFMKNDLKAIEDLYNSKSYVSFINDNYELLLSLGIHRKVQGNIPERGFPVLEILEKMVPEENIAVIELGASFGLIGSCLLDTSFISGNKEIYSTIDQQLPGKIKPVQYYLGIDIDPPEKDWLIACFTIEDDVTRVKKYIESMVHVNFQLIKSSAMGFSTLSEVNNILKRGFTPVVLTSFMLYQFHDELKQKLISEINFFIQKNKGYWIQQEVDISKGMDNLKYEVFFNGNKIIDLTDDKCSKWKWI